MAEAYSPYTIGIPMDRPLEGLEVTDQQKDHPTREDILLPVEVIPLSAVIPPFEPPRRQPHALLAQVIPFMGQETEPRLYNGRGVNQYLIADYGELALVPHEEGGESDLVVQYVSGQFIAREIIPPENRAALLELVERDYPDIYRKIHDDARPDTEDDVVVSGRDGWREADHHRGQREYFHFLSHLLKQAPSGRVRIEHLDVNVEHGNASFLPQVFICEQTDDQTIHVRGAVAEYAMVIGGHRILPVDFNIRTNEGIVVDDAEVERVKADLKAHRMELPEISRNIIEESRIRDGIITSIRSPLHRATRLKGEELAHMISEDGILTYAYEQPLAYAFEGFGQELWPHGHGYDSMKFFDADDTRPTMRTPEDFHRRIFMTEAELEESKDEWKEVERWWKDEIVPKFKEWGQEEVERAARYLQTHRLEVIELIQSELDGETRLFVVGMSGHPHLDHLPFDILEQVSGIDFIAVEVRSPDDATGGLEEDREGVARIELDGGMVVEMSQSEAKRLHPDKYKDPDERDPAWDNVIAEAQTRGIQVIYTKKGKSWKEMNKLGAEEVATYMREHPNAKGIYFTSVFGAMKWPGFATEAEHEAIGFGRPLTNDHVFSTNPRTQDVSVEMPAHALETEFPGQVYSTAQFIMPRGLGEEWKHLRMAVEASGIKDRFAIDELYDAPFAAQRHIFIGLAELADTPVEDLWQYFGTMAHGFFGPAEIRWDKVYDGVVINPSDQPLPPRPTKEQYMRAAAGIIGQIIDESNEDSHE